MIFRRSFTAGSSSPVKFDSPGDSAAFAETYKRSCQGLRGCVATTNPSIGSRGFRKAWQIVEKNVRYPAAIRFATLSSRNLSAFERIVTRSSAASDVSGLSALEVSFHHLSTAGHHHRGQASEKGPLYFALTRALRIFWISSECSETPRRANKVSSSINGPGCWTSS